MERAAALAGAADTAAVSGSISGIDTRYIDSSVRAQDDFFRYSLGKWLTDVEIPSDRSSWGAFNIAQDNVEKQIKVIVEQAGQDRDQEPAPVTDQGATSKAEPASAETAATPSGASSSGSGIAIANTSPARARPRTIR